MKLVLASIALAVGGPAIQTPRQALSDDAALYAAVEQVPQAEAASRFEAEQESVAATDEIARRFAGRLAGITVIHRPDPAIRILLTGDAAVPDEQFCAQDGRIVPIRFVTGAARTLSQLRLALRQRIPALTAAIPGGRGIGIDQRRGGLRLYLKSPPDDPVVLAAQEAKASDLMGAPVRISRIDNRVFDFQVAGGGRVIGESDGKRYACTTGFLVTDGKQSALTTAAHCPDELSYHAPDGSVQQLPYLNAWGARAYDVQLNRVDGAPDPLFYADRKTETLRRVASWRSRTSLRAGDLLCHWGEKSGHACAEVELTDFAPPGALCAGPCEPLFVTTAGPACGPGDSGGPVFVGSVAVGIVKGGSNRPEDGLCNFGFFQSVDYLPPGWRLMLAPTLPARPARIRVPRASRAQRWTPTP